MTVVFVHGNPETPAIWDLLSERLRRVGAVLKSLAPAVEVTCTRPVGAPATTRSRGGERRVVTTDRTDTIADGSPEDD